VKTRISISFELILGRGGRPSGLKSGLGLKRDGKRSSEYRVESWLLLDGEYEHEEINGTYLRGDIGVDLRRFPVPIWSRGRKGLGV